MPPGPPGRPPLAMKLWLARRFRGSGNAESSSSPRGRSLGSAMSMESLEHLESMVKGRVRTFLRHTWAVTILGTLLLVGGVWLTIYLTNKPTVIRVAAGPAGGLDAKFVQVLGSKFVQDRDKIRLQLV